MEQDRVIEDSEGFRDSKGGYGFKEICLQQVQKVVSNGSKEWKKGFWIHNVPPVGQSSQPIKYIGDTRLEYMNSILVLHDLLLPKFEKIKGDMMEQAKNFEKVFGDLEVKYSKRRESGEDYEDLKTEFWEEKLNLHRILFQHLLTFLESLGWLEGAELKE